MAHYALRIIRRREPRAGHGMVVRMHEMDADNDGAACAQALLLLDGLDWDIHFASLEGYPGAFQTSWMTRPNA